MSTQAHMWLPSTRMATAWDCASRPACTAAGRLAGTACGRPAHAAAYYCTAVMDGIAVADL
eukprot:357607-Chlamydomonas_euryale.AAC.3